MCTGKQSLHVSLQALLEGKFTLAWNSGIREERKKNGQFEVRSPS